MPFPLPIDLDNIRADYQAGEGVGLVDSGDAFKCIVRYNIIVCQIQMIRSGYAYTYGIFLSNIFDRRDIP